MAGKPEEQMTSALAARGGLRASDADRDRVVDMIQAAFAQGRLTRDEFAARMGRALQSRTWGELAAVTAELATARPVAPTGARTPAGRKKLAMRAAGAVVLAAMVAAFFTYYGGFIVLLVLAFVATILTGSGPRSGR